MIFMLELWSTLLYLAIIKYCIDQIVKNIGENRSNGTIALFWPVSLKADTSSQNANFSHESVLRKTSTPKDQFSELFFFFIILD